MPTISEEPIDEEMTETSEETAHNISARSSMIPRPGPSKCNDPDYMNCVICGSDRVWLTRKGTQLWDKFRLCTAESAKQFLKAMEDCKDVVYTRCADLKDPDDVYAADLYCHNICFKQYVSMSHTKESLNESKASPKFKVFKDVKVELGPLIEDWYGFTMTEFREIMMNKDDSLQLYNRDVKKLLADYYGEKIQYCPSNRVNESELCFSADITIEDLAKKNLKYECNQVSRRNSQRSSGKS